MANITNMFTAFLSFIFGVMFTIVSSKVMPVLWALFDADAAFEKMIVMFAYFALILLMVVYLPIHIMTSEDTNPNKKGLW